MLDFKQNCLILQEVGGGGVVNIILSLQIWFEQERRNIISVYV